MDFHAGTEFPVVLSDSVLDGAELLKEINDFPPGLATANWHQYE